MTSDNNIQTKNIEGDKCMQYFKAKKIIQKISQRCVDINRIKIDGEKDCIIIQPQYVVPGYTIEGYFLLPEKIYVYKIYQTKEASEQDTNNQLPLSKIIICTEKIESDTLRSSGIHLNVENNRNQSCISMVKKPDGSIEIKVFDVRPDGKKERYFIYKRKGAINKEELYDIKYDIEKKGQGETSNRNFLFQSILNSIIPKIDWSETVDEIIFYCNILKRIKQTPSDLNTEAKNNLDIVCRILSDLVYPKDYNRD